MNTNIHMTVFSSEKHLFCNKFLFHIPDNVKMPRCLNCPRHDSCGFKRRKDSTIRVWDRNILLVAYKVPQKHIP